MSMRFTHLISTWLLMLFIVGLMGTMSGVSHGLSAENASATDIERGEDYSVSKANLTKPRMSDPLPFVSDDMQPAFLQPRETETPGWLASAIVAIVVGAMEWASAVATFTYHNQWWIKAWWAGPLLQLLGYGALFGYLVLSLSHARRLLG